MDPRDRGRPLEDGAACTACGATVPAGRIRVLAQRDDVAFVELECPACDSTTLALLIDPIGTDGSSTLDVDQDASGGHMTMARRVGRPISEADVEALRRDLANWDGDLVGWLEALDRGDRRGTVLDR
jgi:hypothetical protein